jgi:hypothetical protein
MSAPLPAFHTLAIVHLTSPPARVRAPRTNPFARLWTWLMEPLDHTGNRALRARLPLKPHHEGRPGLRAIQ